MSDAAAVSSDVVIGAEVDVVKGAEAGEFEGANGKGGAAGVSEVEAKCGGRGIFELVGVGAICGGGGIVEAVGVASIKEGTEKSAPAGCLNGMGAVGEPKGDGTGDGFGETAASGVVSRRPKGKGLVESSSSVMSVGGKVKAGAGGAEAG